MKSAAKEIVGRTASNKLAWLAYSACGRISNYFGKVYGHARWTREIQERNAFLAKVLNERFSDLIVASGPFKGMRYVRKELPGSALLPKLLGSYESELHSMLETLLANDYATVVDVGCADGYYAVGLALRLKSAQIYAFDIDAQARQTCEEVARINDVSERVHVGGFCDEACLRSLPLGTKALIIADCEGYEKELFSPKAREVLAAHDLIIETHDFIDINISQELRDAFSSTHRVQSISSVDDIAKAHRYHYEQLATYNTQQRRLILGERRPAIMEWLVMTPLARS
jgi:precorrin-6B methylase 2